MCVGPKNFFWYGVMGLNRISSLIDHGFPVTARATGQWGRALVTDYLSQNNVQVSKPLNLQDSSPQSLQLSLRPLTRQ